MADLGFEIPEDFLKDLLDHDFDEIAPEMLEKVAPVLKEATQKAIRSAESGHGTGELERSVKVTKPKKTATDAYIVNVGPSGVSKSHYYDSASHSRKYPVSNALKAIWLNYGNAHQAPRPWLTPAVNSCESKILSELQKLWEDKVGKE